jgi:hypothetical protein
MASSARFPFLFLCALLALAVPGRPQDLREQITPFSVWLDFQALSRPNPPKVALPIWLESVISDHQPAGPGSPEQTVFRLRLRRMGHLNSEVSLRVFFTDDPAAGPVVSAWTETGLLRFLSDRLGADLNLPTSATLSIPTAGTDYIDITVPGDGHTVRGAFIATEKKGETSFAFDFAPATTATDPFGNLPPVKPEEHDSYLFGRVKATLEPGIVKLTPGTADGMVLEFELDRPPLLAVVTFEMLNADVMYPPEIAVNERPLGAPAVHLPELADPAYLGEVRPLERDMRFRYTGWLRCQKVIPGSALQAGVNRLKIRLDRHSGPSAVRAVTMQLKHNWQNLDYTLTP